MKHPRVFILPLLWLCIAATPRTWGADGQLHLNSGQLRFALTNNGAGFTVQSLKDSLHNRELLATSAKPLFTLALRDASLTNEVFLRADSGWRQPTARSRSRKLELVWETPTIDTLEGISVKATAVADADAPALRWQLQVLNKSTNWTVWRVTFPDLSLAEPASNPSILFPRGPGEVQTKAWTRPFEYGGNYPDGWCSMQFVAAYDGGSNGTGLYVGMHDPFGSTKTIVLQSQPQVRALRAGFEHPAPNMGVVGNEFALEGTAVWQLLRGDWFDAAMIYKAWAQKQARWWPQLGRDGRADTPRWMRELSSWAMTGGASTDCVARVTEFRTFLNLPLGFHWYNWHQIPFDNDYPHYFPAKVGFEDGVAQLKAAGVFPMPYINGRLWDSRDLAATDLQFTRLALPSVTKKFDGSAELESYGSKETNGEPVRLGVMCPSTPLWRNTVSNIVGRLLAESGTSGVYIDQVAAAAPKLCMDRSHGHPLGGGHWWTESYWRMLDDIRRAMPLGTMLTTECNAEPFVRWFDGYLTWHWQYDGQVPAFPAIYGGTIQMFGRAYRGGATKDLALRMKAGQQLVFGEQLGWLDPGLVTEKENAEFFKRVAEMRSKFSRYFYAGQMVRAPRLLGELPKVKADWQWSGEWWVTTEAVLAGAWSLPRQKRLVLLFVNVGDQTVTASVQTDFQRWGMPKRGVRCELISSSPGSSGTSVQHATLKKTTSSSALFQGPVAFASREVQAWEFTW